MSFNQRIVKSYASGVTSAFAAPWASFKGSVIALNGAVSGTTTSTAGLVINPSGPTYDIEWDTLSANVQVVIATASLVATGVWQVSQDGTNWVTLYPLVPSPTVAVAPAGAGTTTYCHAANGIGPMYPYIRYAIVNTAATGGAGDNVTVSYNYRKRWTA